MFARKKPDVLIVGAGPVGLFTALALTRRGVRVEIIEQEPRAASRSYALALHAESLRLLDELSALQPVLEKASRVRRIGIYDGADRAGELNITELAEDYSFLAILSQSQLEDTLVKALADQGVKVQWSHAIAQLAQQPDHVDVTVDRLSLDTLGYTVQHADWVVAKSRVHQVPFVIGADGHRSTVRQRIGIEFPSVGDHKDFVVFEGRTDVDLGDELELCLDGKTTNLCWPLPGGHCRWSFEQPLEDEFADTRRKDRDVVQLPTEHTATLTQERLDALLAERAPWFEGKVAPIRWRTAVRFPKRLAAAFGQGRVWLVGDAGHMTGPAGIQSMNVGFREGMQLAAAIHGALQGDRTQLDRYSDERIAEWRGLLGLDLMLEKTADTPAWVVPYVDRLLPCLPASGRDLARLAEQLGLRCRLPGQQPVRA